MNTESTQTPESLGSPLSSPACVPYVFPATQCYGDFRLPWRHDTFIHPAWGHEIHRVLSLDNCECFYGTGKDCIQIVNASRGTDANREASLEWSKLSAYVKKKFHLANTTIEARRDAVASDKCSGPNNQKTSA